MKQTLKYGRISWAYDDFDPKVSCKPTPLVKFSPIRINGKLKYLDFSDKIALALLKHKTDKKLPYREAYREWLTTSSWKDRDLGEGRAFLRWLQTTGYSVAWRAQDIQLHSYFTDDFAPKHDPQDELAQDLSFAVKPVEVDGRRVKLYLQDEAVLGLVNMPYGEEQDFMELVKQYVKMRFKWEEWRAPAPTFFDWTQARGIRAVFGQGQLGFCLLP